MHQLHRNASEAIFAERNAHGLDAGGASVLVDLHGLHPEEAIHHTSSRLRELKQKRFSGKVYVIAGTGHHSRYEFTYSGVAQKYCRQSRTHCQKNGE